MNCDVFILLDEPEMRGRLYCTETNDIRYFESDNELHRLMLEAFRVAEEQGGKRAAPAAKVPLLARARVASMRVTLIRAGIGKVCGYAWLEGGTETFKSYKELMAILKRRAQPACCSGRNYGNAQTVRRALVN